MNKQQLVLLCKSYAELNEVNNYFNKLGIDLQPESFGGNFYSIYTNLTQLIKIQLNIEEITDEIGEIIDTMNLSNYLSHIELLLEVTNG